MGRRKKTTEEYKEELESLKDKGCILTLLEGQAYINAITKIKHKCNCGNIKEMIPSNVLGGLTKSCGCLLTKRTKTTEEYKEELESLKDKGCILTLFERQEYKGAHTKIKHKCNCGNIKEIAPSCILSGLTKSCGCLVAKQAKTTEEYKEELESLEGCILTLLEGEEYINKDTKIKHKCNCGNIKEIRPSSILRGKTKSCGCLGLGVNEPEWYRNKKTILYYVLVEHPDTKKIYWKPGITLFNKNNIEESVIDRYYNDIRRNNKIFLKYASVYDDGYEAVMDEKMILQILKANQDICYEKNNITEEDKKISNFMGIFNKKNDSFRGGESELFLVDISKLSFIKGTKDIKKQTYREKFWPKGKSADFNDKSLINTKDIKTEEDDFLMEW